MAHIRVVVFEIDQPDQACFDAIQRLIGGTEQTSQPTIQVATDKVVAPNKVVLRGRPRGPYVKKQSESPQVSPPTDGSAPIVEPRTGTICREALRKYGPLSSAELIDKTKLHPSTVYAWLALNRKGGSVETSPNDNGISKNTLVR
jgi:hypothetical protein